MSFKKIWNFIWHEDSVLSWVVSIALAFLLVKFIIYPLIGLVLGTGYPIVAVVSESMEHKASCSSDDCSFPKMCGQGVDKAGSFGFYSYWEICGEWYEDHDITQEEFEEFRLKNGFNKGDVIVLVGEEPKDIKVGDVVVFDGNLNYPIIHRVVDKWKDGDYYFQTKGDNNERVSGNEEEIHEDKIIGKAVFRLPLLGWIKIRFSEFVGTIGGVLK